SIQPERILIRQILNIQAAAHLSCQFARDQQELITLSLIAALRIQSQFAHTLLRLQFGIDHIHELVKPKEDLEGRQRTSLVSRQENGQTTTLSRVLILRRHKVMISRTQLLQNQEPRLFRRIRIGMDIRQQVVGRVGIEKWYGHLSTPPTK